MLKIFSVVFLIFGTVVGSGFSSGKEIMVFFSQFGITSYLYIFVAGFLFYAVFFFFLEYGNKISKKLEESKILNFMVLFISLVFCSSMFAGIKNLFSYFSTPFFVISFVSLVILCLLVTKKGIRSLEKVNLVLMPLTMLCFIFVLGFCVQQHSDFSFSNSPWAGAFYGPLYVALNTCMSGFVISRAGDGLSKKQKRFSCLLATCLIVGLLLFGNFVLLNNSESFFSEMPFLSLASKNENMFYVAFLIIFCGCFTTLISLCYTLKVCLSRIIKNETTCVILSVFMPLIASQLGFSQIVSFLYPICSVLGIFMLGFLLVKTFHEKKKTFSLKD